MCDGERLPKRPPHLSFLCVLPCSACCEPADSISHVVTRQCQLAEHFPPSAYHITLHHHHHHQHHHYPHTPVLALSGLICFEMREEQTMKIMSISSSSMIFQLVLVRPAGHFQLCAACGESHASVRIDRTCLRVQRCVCSRKGGESCLSGHPAPTG